MKSNFLIGIMVGLVFMADIGNHYLPELYNVHQEQSIGDMIAEDKLQVECLADNVFYEAANQSREGMEAVALVTMNRVYHKHFPKKVCDVVFQKNKYRCQFSWVCQKNLQDKDNRYIIAYEVARKVFTKYIELEDITEGALYYHANYVNPKWKLHKTVVIGSHIFYKESSNDDAKTKSTVR